jgi:hypothetical protein
MPTCNGITIPEMIRTNRIISAFANPVDSDKVDQYAEQMRSTPEILPYCIPPIKGYPSILDENDVENEVTFMDGTVVDETMIGEMIWYVTDGHHRTFAAIEANLPYLCTDIDESCITDYDELLKIRAQSA